MGKYFRNENFKKSSQKVKLIKKINTTFKIVVSFGV